MKILHAFALVALAMPLVAQEPVTGAADPDALFKGPNKKLEANKQVVYHIMKDLLEANHWELADKYLTPEYLQHNPNVKSGRDGVVAFFTATRKPTPIPEKFQKTKIVSVLAEDDMVLVATPREYKDPKDPSKTYTTTWFDMWKIVNGKANEHWDSAMK